MSKHWKQFSWRLPLASTLAIGSALAILPSIVHAQEQTKGIDTGLLDKANAGDAAAQTLVGIA